MADNDMPVMSLLSSAESIYMLRKKYRFVFVWAIASGMWIIATTALFITYMLVGKNYQAGIIDAVALLAVILGFPIFITAWFTVNYSGKVSKQMEDFLKDFLPIWIKVRMELLPSTGDSQVQKLRSKIKEIYPSYRNFKRNSKKFQEIQDSVAQFDILVGRKKEIALAKISDSNDLITLDNLKTMENDALRIAKKLKAKVRLMAVVQNQFNEELIRWESERESLGRSGTTVLFLVPSENNFQVQLVTSTK